MGADCLCVCAFGVKVRFAAPVFWNNKGSDSCSSVCLSTSCVVADVRFCCWFQCVQKQNWTESPPKCDNNFLPPGAPWHPTRQKKHPNANKSTPKMIPRARNTCLVFAAPNADFATSPDTLKTRIGQGRCQKQALFSTVRGARAPPKDAKNPQGPPGGRQEASVRQQAAGPPGGRPEAPRSPSRGERGFLMSRGGYYQNCGRFFLPWFW